MDEHDFAEDYFCHDCGPPYRRDEFWTAFFGRIADLIVSRIGPRRVLDAGCAMGFLVESLRDRGVEAYGCDLSSYALAHAPAAVRPFLWQASVADEISGRYDLIVCQEVLPHLALPDAERAVANFCRHTDDVLFSVSPYPPAPRHANIEPPQHWARVFAQHGFHRDFDFDAGVITPWAVRYRRSGDAVDAIVHRYEERILTLRAERDAERRERAAAESHIRAMERSWFWKARRLWTTAKRLTTGG